MDEDGYYGDEERVSPWQQLNSRDFGLLGFTAVHHLIVLCVVVHLACKRDWPPYVTKNVTLVAATGLGSSFSLVAGLIEEGIVRREPEDFLAQCCAEAFLASIGTALQFFPAFVRVYRNYTLLILHSAAMWSGMIQLLAVSLPYIVPAIVYLAKPSLAEFEEHRNHCFDNLWMDLASFVYMAVGISCAIALVVKMRRVRKQLNEFRVMTVSLAFLMVWALYLKPAGHWFWIDSPTIARRLVMIDNFVSTAVLFWCPIAVPFLKYLQQDQHYVSQFTFGFSRLPTPAQMRASLADQLGVEDLRKKFSMYAAGRVARELPDFYTACMNREQEEGYFERKAMTMSIVDKYLTDGAEHEINISQECKERVLETDITRYNIFDEAIAEVLYVMEVNFKTDFERTKEYRNLNVAVEREAKELQVLRQAKLVPEPKDKGEPWPMPDAKVRGENRLRPFLRNASTGDTLTQAGTPLAGGQGDIIDAERGPGECSKHTPLSIAADELAHAPSMKAAAPPSSTSEVQQSARAAPTPSPKRPAAKEALATVVGVLPRPSHAFASLRALCLCACGGREAGAKQCGCDSHRDGQGTDRFGLGKSPGDDDGDGAVLAHAETCDGRSRPQQEICSIYSVVAGGEGGCNGSGEDGRVARVPGIPPPDALSPERQKVASLTHGTSPGPATRTPRPPLQGSRVANNTVFNSWPGTSDGDPQPAVAVPGAPHGLEDLEDALVSMDCWPRPFSSGRAGAFFLSARSLPSRERFFANDTGTAAVQSQHDKKHARTRSEEYPITAREAAAALDAHTAEAPASGNSVIRVSGPERGITQSGRRAPKRRADDDKCRQSDDVSGLSVGAKGSRNETPTREGARGAGFPAWSAGRSARRKKFLI